LPALSQFDVFDLRYRCAMSSKYSHLGDDNLPVVIAFARTPFGRFEGKLAALTAPRLGALAIDEILRRTPPLAQPVCALYAGIGMLGGSTLTATRQAVLMSSLPRTTPSFTVDRACCSGMTAIGLASKEIRLGESVSMICGGFDSLSQTPLLWPRRRDRRPSSVTVEDPLLLRAPVVDRQIAVYTGEEALRNGVTREQQDEWALQSHARYHEAESNGYFAAERFCVDLTIEGDEQVTIDRDESPRADTSIEKLAKLKPIYGGKTVTAGNAPGLNDGAAFLLLMKNAAARSLGLTPCARILGYAQVADEPTSGTSTPAVAIQKVLRSHNLTPDHCDMLEINEAYAATPLVSTLRLADGDLPAAMALRSRTNVHGGAVAIGHPLGASGARIVMTLIAGLQKRGGGRGVAAICGGFGQGDALLLEV
jgi:acetyl-CoA C-acetyltransferase